MMQFDRMALGKKARELGFVRDTFEKVCRLADVLDSIQKDALLSNALALKGGTAINLTIFNLPRLSVDIDMDFSENLPREETNWDFREPEHAARRAKQIAACRKYSPCLVLLFSGSRRNCCKEFFVSPSIR